MIVPRRGVHQWGKRLPPTDADLRVGIIPPGRQFLGYGCVLNSISRAPQFSSGIVRRSVILDTPVADRLGHTRNQGGQFIHVPVPQAKRVPLTTAAQTD